MAGFRHQGPGHEAPQQGQPMVQARDAVPERHRRAAARGQTHDGAGDYRRATGSGYPVHRKQAIGMQEYIFHAMRRRDGTVVVGEGSPARWRLKEAD
jgi:hypothetical protein